MQPRQLELLDAALDAVTAACERSPVATWSTAHLEALLVEHLLRAGASILERGAEPGEDRLVRLTGDLLRAERCVLDPRHRLRRRRGRRVADLRVLEPVPLALDLYARSTAAGVDRLAPRALRERIASLTDGASEALLIACDRRAYDALRAERHATDDPPPELARLCALLLPPSCELGADRTIASRKIASRGFRATAVMGPMVFGVQRVVAALWPAQRASEPVASDAQMDAFER